jgi:excisionase family DNA binding protein
MSEHLTVEQFCEKAPMGKTRLYVLLNEGRIKAKKDGKRTLIPVSEFNAWKESLPDYLGAQMGAQKTR